MYSIYQCYMYCRCVKFQAKVFQNVLFAMLKVQSSRFQFHTYALIRNMNTRQSKEYVWSRQHILSHKNFILGSGPALELHAWEQKLEFIESRYEFSLASEIHLYSAFIFTFTSNILGSDVRIFTFTSNILGSDVRIFIRIRNFLSFHSSLRRACFLNLISVIMQKYCLYVYTITELNRLRKDCPLTIL